jgi:PHD/YefM family antitoxin component YafN of YafNO toxin-antitoxin module
MNKIEKEIIELNIDFKDLTIRKNNMKNVNFIGNDAYDMLEFSLKIIDKLQKKIKKLERLNK